MKILMTVEDWISVQDDLPQIDPHYEHISVEVEVLLLDGAVKKAFYSRRQEAWYAAEGCRVIPYWEVTAWRSIEEGI